jgi:ribosomal protein S12 methylthiotransferase accessory factor YcaO
MRRPREQKRKEAEVRQAERDKRTDEQQLARLDLFLGEGVGAQRERARIAARIEAAQRAVAEIEAMKARKAQTEDAQPPRRKRRRRRR